MKRCNELKVNILLSKNINKMGLKKFFEWSYGVCAAIVIIDVILLMFFDYEIFRHLDKLILAWIFLTMAFVKFDGKS